MLLLIPMFTSASELLMGWLLVSPRAEWVRATMDLSLTVAVVCVWGRLSNCDTSQLLGPAAAAAASAAVLVPPRPNLLLLLL